MLEGRLVYRSTDLLRFPNHSVFQSMHLHIRDRQAEPGLTGSGRHAHFFDLQRVQPGYLELPVAWKDTNTLYSF
jgi:hypothetical protein